MSALSLFDYFASRSGADKSRAAPSDAASARADQLARQLIESSLRQLGDIDAQDEQIGQSYQEGEFDQHVAALLRGMYGEWASATEQVLRRVDGYELARGVRLPEAQRLRDGYGRVRAMLSVSLADIVRGMEEVRQGKTLSAKEVRHALHLRPRP